MTDQAAHSPLGASAAHRWLNCPASVALIATLAEQPETPDMRAGTAAHEVAEKCLRSGTDADTYIDETVNGHCITEEDACAVQVYLDWFRELTRDGRAEHVSIERSFHLAKLDAQFWGRNDCSAYIPEERTLYVGDYKHGVGMYVSPVDNKQLKYYGLGALLAHPMTPIERVVLAIVQPRSYQDGDGVRMWQTTPLELMEYGLELRAAAKATREPNAPYVCGEYCETCPAAGACPALYSKALEAAGISSADETPKEPGALSAEELGRRLELADMLRLWLNRVQSFAFGEAMRGRLPDGRKLIQKGDGRRAWADGAAMLVDALDTFNGVKLQHLVKSKPVSPAQLEKVVGKKAAAGFIEGRLKAKPPAYALVPLSHKGEPVTPPALSEFEPIDIGAFEDD